MMGEWKVIELNIKGLKVYTLGREIGNGKVQFGCSFSISKSDIEQILKRVNKANPA